MTQTPEMPPGSYSFVDEYSIEPEEIIDLRNAGDWGTETNREVWASVLNDSIATVGVRDEAGLLVGVGFLTGNARHAVLCDFIVHPEHRGQGIGSAILQRRVDIADELGIPYLYTELAKTNVLTAKYETLGFAAAGNVYTRASRRHPSETE
jgi:GNAT superfamily N-acetyltransferase